MNFALSCLLVALAIRLISLSVSRRHERALKAAGAVEHDTGTTRALATTHVLFYLAAATEGALLRTLPDALSWAGVTLWTLAMLALVLVVRELGGLWTIKLIIAPQHEVKSSSLFRWLRHPNYFLNVLPELLGLALALHAWLTLALLLPPYLLILRRRIRNEEVAMRAACADYPA